MNKVFKVVWSKAKCCYVVASELAKSRTKSPGCKTLRRTLVCSVFAAVLSCAVVNPAMADSGWVAGYYAGNYYTGRTNQNPAGGSGNWVYTSFSVNQAAIENKSMTMLIGYNLSDGSFRYYIDASDIGGDASDYSWRILSATEAATYFDSEETFNRINAVASSGANSGASGSESSYTAGNGIIISENTISAKAGTNVTVNGDGISVTGNGTVASGNIGLIDGGKLYSEVRPSDNGNYEENFITLL